MTLLISGMIHAIIYYIPYPPGIGNIFEMPRGIQATGGMVYGLSTRSTLPLFGRFYQMVIWLTALSLNCPHGLWMPS